MNAEANLVAAGLVGQEVTQLRFDFALTLLTHDAWWVVLGAAGHIDGHRFATHDYADAVNCLLCVHKKTVASCIISADLLVLEFSGGRRLVGESSPEHGGWHITAPDGRTLQCAPGGVVEVHDSDAGSAARSR